MVALLNITNLEIQNNPANFQEPISMQITFESSKNLEEEDCIEWKLIYVGSAKDESKDIVLDSFSMGPIEEGVMQFVLESEPPQKSQIPSKEDLLGITAIILSVSYKNQEFFRCGYYVYNQYTDPELIENDPSEILIDKVQRSILTDKPRITRFDIDWNDGQKKVQEEQYQKEIALLQQQGQENSNGIQFYQNSNNNSIQQPLDQQQQQQNNNNSKVGNNSLSFGMFNNQQTMQELSSRFQNPANSVQTPENSQNIFNNAQQQQQSNSNQLPQQQQKSNAFSAEQSYF